MRSLRDSKSERKKDRNHRFMVAGQQFDAQRVRAELYGLTLKHEHGAVYSISRGFSWRVILHVGSHYMESDRKYGKPPFLALVREWTLEDVVTAAIAAIGKDST